MAHVTVTVCAIARAGAHNQRVTALSVHHHFHLIVYTQLPVECKNTEVTITL